MDWVNETQRPAEHDRAARRSPGTAREPIAIIGIGCRFPGGVYDPASFWRLMRDGIDAIGEIPPDRFDIEAYYDPMPATPGKFASRYGGFLNDIDRFDASFFHISPREAERLDPQQRLLLEVAWESIEDAGLPLSRLVGSSTGVYIGMWLNDYETRLFADASRVDFHMTSGTGRYSASGRLSYFLGLEGPSITVDTACSSSLVAVHLACQSLWNDETELALAGGANVILQPQISIAYSQSGMIAPDGRCKFGDARANGYVRGEGAGIVVLKRLSRALADGDQVYALIRGSAVTNDGQTSGYLTTPGRGGQEAMLRRAYRDAGVAPSQVQYIEAHGTGTAAGDPVELGALGAVLGAGRPADRPCLVGSVKSNIGHTEGAAGIAGLIKVALSLRNREIPGTLHFQQPNPAIPWDQLGLAICSTRVPWPKGDGPGLAGVSSFGIAGTNAHIVLQEAPAAVDRGSVPAHRAPRPHVLPISARDGAALHALAEAHIGFLSARDESGSPELADVCRSASLRRTHHDHRLAVVGRSREELVERLAAFLNGDRPRGVRAGRAPAKAPSGLAAVFPGQGSQWLGMGQRLLASEPAFREALETCERALAPYVDWSPRGVIAGQTPELLDRIDVIQPMLFAIQVGLAAVWRSWGVVPNAVVGHSMGEVAAAHVAGVLTLEDAARVICLRSSLMRRVSGQGAMAVVGLGRDEAETIVAEYRDRLSVAASNAPGSTVLSGDPAALDEVLTALQARDIFCRRVNVDVASHSPQMELLQAELQAGLAGIQPGPATIPFYSTVTGELQEGERCDAGYWTRNLRQPVLFSTAVQQLARDGYTTFLELSPHPILTLAVEETLGQMGHQGRAIASLYREADEQESMLDALGALYTAGYPIAWEQLYPEGGTFVRLPRYPWQSERFWLDHADQHAASAGAWAPHVGGAVHPLLGAKLVVAGQPDVHAWETRIEARRLPRFFAHRIHGNVVLPASAFIELAVAAADQVFGEGPTHLRDVAFERPLMPRDDQPCVVQVVLTRGGLETANFTICSRSGDDWTVHAAGSIQREMATIEPRGGEQYAMIPVAGEEARTGDTFYAQLETMGLSFDSPLRYVTRLRRGEGFADAELAEPKGVDGPSLSLDACFQVAVAALPLGADVEDIRYLPAHVDEVRLHGPVGRGAHSRARVQAAPHVGEVREDVALLDDAGVLLAEIRGLCLRRVGFDQGQNPGDWLYDIKWLPGPHAEESAKPESSAAGTWLVLTDRGGVGEALARQLVADGDRCLLVSPGESYVRRGDRASVRPAMIDDMRRLVQDALRGEPGECCGVMHLWSLDIEPNEHPDDVAIERADRLGSLSAVAAVQAISERRFGEPPRIWLVTSGVQPVRITTAPGQSPLWGLGRVIAEEHPEHWGGLVDLDPTYTPDAAAAALHREIRATDGEDQVALVDEKRLVPRLVARQRTNLVGESYRWAADAAYLVTGGFGGIGAEAARWMVEQGARRLVLMSRTPLPPRREWRNIDPSSEIGHRIEVVQSLERLGASVHLAAVDVADEAQMRAFIEEYTNEGWPAIRGVLHAAGIVDDRLVGRLDASSFRAVLRPKVRGAWLLHRFLGDLDFFVVFSSIGALLGQPGQASYAAANAFLDAFAHYRRSLGLPALSVNWGGWNDLGFAATPGGRQTVAALERQGIQGISVTDGLAVLGSLISAAAHRGVDTNAQVAVLPIDASRLKGTSSTIGRTRLLDDVIASLTEDTDCQSASDADQPTASILATLANAEPSQRRVLLEDFLREQVGQVLRLAPAKVEPSRALGTLGLESLMAVELRNRLEAGFGLKLSPTLVWNYPTVADLVTYLEERLGYGALNEPLAPPVAEAAAESAHTDTGLDTALKHIRDLSDADAWALIRADH